ncbi:mandelate racemase/muconate lactonizing enzyme family protein [Nonomuraea sp. B10E15]|uniref:mandelate racemase/muconate lactonizing enzyme family protein n=1 Tax=Nonomuraea sp. B10E15 TaxID=3153560 RepID=UPI00325D73A7
MKITDVRAVPVRGGRRTYLFVLVDTDEGVLGIGESGLASRGEAVCGALDHLRPLLIGQDPLRTEHLWQVMSRGGFFPADRVGASAIAAVDLALWDIKGKALGVPVHVLLGGRVRDRVPCYTHVRPERDGPAEVARACMALREEGWRALRLALPASGETFEPHSAVRMGVECFSAAREAVGEDVDLILDVHTRLDPPEAVLLCRELEPLRPLFVEDPLRCENLGAYRTLRERTAVPLAAGEQLASKWDFRPLIEDELIDYARIDLCIAGGLTEATKIAGWCETHYLRVAVHNPLGPVATAAAVHFNLACTAFGVQEQPYHPAALLPEVFPMAPEWRDGSLLPLEKPGLGLAIDLDALAAARTTTWNEPPRLSRNDGSFTNW